MVDQTTSTPETTTPTVKSPTEMLQDMENSVKDTANSVLGEGTIDSLKNTATQVSGTISQVTNVVSGQVENLSQKVGGEEFVGEVKDIVSPITTIVTDVLKIAFFAKKQNRISRGQFIIGSLSVVVIVGLIVAIIAAVIGSLGVWFGQLIIAIPLINLAVKRFHDLNKSGWWSVSIIIPLVGWVMPVLLKGVNENNLYGPDPLIEDKTDLTFYLITGLSLLILSVIVTTILGYLGLHVATQKIDVTDPNYIANQVGGDTTSTIKNTTTNTINSTTNTLK